MRGKRGGTKRRLSLLGDLAGSGLPALQAQLLLLREWVAAGMVPGEVCGQGHNPCSGLGILRVGNRAASLASSQDTRDQSSSEIQHLSLHSRPRPGEMH